MSFLSRYFEYFRMNKLVQWFYILCFFGGFSVLFMLFRTDVKKKYLNPTLESLFLHNAREFIEEVPDYSCPSNVSEDDAEDILCAERKRFLTNFKNPCWFEEVYKYDDYSAEPVSELRCFPYFHVFGVCKTGTTDLFYRLTRHPQILNNFGLLNKETWFWSWRRYGQGSYNGTKITLDEFSRIFKADEIGRTKIALNDLSQYSDLITGHGDPMDFWDHRHWREIPQNNPLSNAPRYMTPHLVKHVQPKIKLILVLREPAERLYSHYYHGGYGHSAEEFHHSVITAIHRLDECMKYSSYRSCIYGYNMTTQLHLPITASLYYIHLQEWLDVFPREQVFIIRNEDYRKDMKHSLLKLFSFLEVGDISSNLLKDIVEMPHRYETVLKNIQGSMLNETWNILVEFFEEPNRKLAAMLNDGRYLWRDTTFKFRPKKKMYRKHRPHIGPADHLRTYYEKKRKSKLNPDSVIDRFIMTSKSFGEWVEKVKQHQQQRIKAHQSVAKRPEKIYHHEKRKHEKQMSGNGAHRQNITIKMLRTVTNSSDFNKKRTGVVIRQENNPLHDRKHIQNFNNRPLKSMRKKRRVHFQK
ncbi:carbohydrate sulfotransferase 15-like isoform X3 [Ostrea edulis]|uniref:carbohydrate sulfotransferase 15-like isoform X3 n=2 Tax=Ostrea edulis TaxID=37623 RepID=UPI0024AE8A6A|nr:carbohydrate sulfotransferase 15-like isoform X3 [Ostrea edulis]